MTPAIPHGLLLDLDDTILNDSGRVRLCWTNACDAHAAECGLEASLLLDAIEETSRWYWADAERHRIGRLDLAAARAEVVRLALARHDVENADMARKISGLYGELRRERMELLPDAVDTIRWFRSRGSKLALLTNGNAVSQREKIVRFQLEPMFDAIFIEGDVGFGKPDPRIFRMALTALGVGAGESWMVGDNLEWDIAGAQAVGIFAIWIDPSGTGRSRLASIVPDRIVASLGELRSMPPV